MKRKLFSLLALLMVAVTGAWADVDPTYDLKVGTNAQGSVKFYIEENEVTAAPEGATVTVKITPETGWSLGSIEGQWYAAESATKAPRRTTDTTIPLLNGFELTFVSEDAQTGALTYTFTMERANAEITVDYRKLLTHTDITFSDIDELTFNGKAQKPEVVVKDGETTLVEGTDYTIAYTNNLHAGQADAEENAPTVTFTGIGKYDGEVAKTFTINKAESAFFFYEETNIHLNKDEVPFINPLTIDGAADIEYTVSDPQVATIDPLTGEIDFVGIGFTVVNATITDSQDFIFGETVASYALHFYDLDAYDQYKADKAAEAEDMAEEGDSEECTALIEQAVSDIDALQFSTLMNQYENYLPIDEIVEKLAEDLAALRAEELDDFEEVMTEEAANLAEEGDSEECQQLIADAKEAIAAIMYDKTMTLQQQKDAIAAIVEQLKADLETARQTTVDGIRSMDNGQWTIDNFYDLSGRRVAQPTKGVYILNGKKVVIK